MENTVKIRYVESDSELYLKYQGQQSHQPVYVALDLRTNELYCEINYEINATPIDVFNGMILWFKIPTLKKHDANELLDKFVPYAQSMLDNIENLDNKKPKFKNVDQYFEDLFDMQFLAENTNDLDAYWEYDIRDYFCECSLSELGINLDMSENEVKKQARILFYESEYPLDGDSEDLFDYLMERIEDEKEDLED